MTTPDDLKRAWNETSSYFDQNDPQLAALIERVRSGRRQTALDRLAARYRRFSIMSLLITVAWTFCCLGSIIPPQWKLTLLLSYDFYFLLASTMDYWLFRGISAIDPLTMGVEQVSRLCRFYRRRHLQFMIVLIPMAAALFALMAMAFGADVYVLAAMAVGAMTGTALGIRQYLNFMSDYKTIV